jgi:tetratricopeptide (TPR) repeat protein
MAEPLMRLCLEVKNQRGRPLRLVARFLRAWFTVDKLQQSVGKLDITSRAAEYCQAALLTDNSFEQVINSELESEIRQLIDAGNVDAATALAEELSVSDPFKALEYQAEAACFSGDLDLAIKHLTRLLNSTDAPADQIATALYNRGVTYRQLGDTDAAIADYTAVIGMSHAPAELKIGALLNRGWTHGQLGDTDAAIADCTAVIEMPDAPAEQRAKALYSRGVTYWQLGHNDAEITDYTAVIGMSDAPSELIATALAGRGVNSWRKGEWEASQNDFENALSIAELPSEVRTPLLFEVPIPMVALRPLDDVLLALATAFENGNQDSEAYGGTPRDLLTMILKKGPSEWSEYVAAITPLYVQHGVAEKLGQGITQSIEDLDEGGFSESQRDLWNDVWQTAGQECDDLQIPLECLDAAVKVMKSDPPTDRPLFRLPLEIRQLVRPLLNNPLGPAEDG